MVRVLLVENDANLNFLYRVRLKQTGYEVIAVDTGVKALAVVMHERIDIVVMDLALTQFSPPAPSWRELVSQAQVGGGAAIF